MPLTYQQITKRKTIVFKNLILNCIKFYLVRKHLFGRFWSCVAKYEHDRKLVSPIFFALIRRCYPSKFSNLNIQFNLIVLFQSCKGCLEVKKFGKHKGTLSLSRMHVPRICVPRMHVSLPVHRMSFIPTST